LARLLRYIRRCISRDMHRRICLADEPKSVAIQWIYLFPTALPASQNRTDNQAGASSYHETSPRVLPNVFPNFGVCLFIVELPYVLGGLVQPTGYLPFLSHTGLRIRIRRIFVYRLRNTMQFIGNHIFDILETGWSTRALGLCICFFSYFICAIVFSHCSPHKKLKSGGYRQ
jgi:hypothetical protein